MASLNSIIEKCRGKLARWKADHLSKAGRVCLIKSTLSALPVYQMSCIRLPRTTIGKINSLCANFLWGGKDKKGLHLMAWDKVCQPLWGGGLGIRNLEFVNEVALMKLCWKMVKYPHNLASRMLVSKYIHCRGHAFSFSKGSYLWKGLRNAWTKYQGLCKWNIGEGNGVSVWLDQWVDFKTLRSMFHGPLPLHLQHLTVVSLIQNGS